MTRLLPFAVLRGLTFAADARVCGEAIRSFGALIRRRMVNGAPNYRGGMAMEVFR
ncbi:MAG: hypothetical protein HZC23_11385 [Rhodocyclales bacterium]|nr:hypothetical protein [Rhodocyclales bacterium]